MIHAVKIQNFKNILDQRIELDRFRVFVGANGSGKTSVLEAIEIIDLAHSVVVRRKGLDWRKIERDFDHATGIHFRIDEETDYD